MTQRHTVLAITQRQVRQLFAFMKKRLNEMLVQHKLPLLRQYIADLPNSSSVPIYSPGC